MSVLDLPCEKSTSFSNSCCNPDGNSKSLLLGGRYYDPFVSCLYFTIPNDSNINKLKSAKLILYKLPLPQEETNETVCCSGKRSNYHIKCGYDSSNYEFYDYGKRSCQKECRYQYFVAPLLNFFSVYSCQYSMPLADFGKKTSFEDDIRLCYFEIDITDIAKQWINNSLENRGLILAGEKNAELIRFASERNDIDSMAPTLRLVYDTCGGSCCRISSVPCNVKIETL